MQTPSDIYIIRTCNIAPCDYEEFARSTLCGVGAELPHNTLWGIRTELPPNLLVHLPAEYEFLSNYPMLRENNRAEIVQLRQEGKPYLYCTRKVKLVYQVKSYFEIEFTLHSSLGTHPLEYLCSDGLIQYLVRPLLQRQKEHDFTLKLSKRRYLDWKHNERVWGLSDKEDNICTFSTRASEIITTFLWEVCALVQ